MAPPLHTMQLAGRTDWALMTAIHDALRRDLESQPAEQPDHEQIGEAKEHECRG